MVEEVLFKRLFESAQGAFPQVAASTLIGAVVFGAKALAKPEGGADALTFFVVVVTAAVGVGWFVVEPLTH
jgi:hypothetical protein